MIRGAELRRRREATASNCVGVSASSERTDSRSSSAKSWTGGRRVWSWVAMVGTRKIRRGAAFAMRSVGA